MLFLYIIFLVFLFVFAVFFINQFYNIFFRKFPVFIATKQKAVRTIVKNLDIRSAATVYELGCGKAGFLQAVREKYPQAKLIGIEYILVPYLISKLINVIKNNNIQVLKQDIFKINLKDADVIYCYLGCDMMKRLEEKFTKECKKGALIISYQFIVPNIEPDKILEISKKEKVYFYKII